MTKPKIKGNYLDDIEIPDGIWNSVSQKELCKECNECDNVKYISNECDL